MIYTKIIPYYLFWFSLIWYGSVLPYWRCIVVTIDYGMDLTIILCYIILNGLWFVYTDEVFCKDIMRSHCTKDNNHGLWDGSHNFFFSDSKDLQAHIDSVNQVGKSTSMCTTKDGCFLPLRAKLYILVFSVLGT